MTKPRYTITTITVNDLTLVEKALIAKDKSKFTHAQIYFIGVDQILKEIDK